MRKITTGTTRCAAVAFVLLTAAGALYADGIIIINPPTPPVSVVMPHPTPPPKPVVRPLAIKNHIVKVRMNGAVCRTEVDETFYNPNNRVLEGTYIFPLPEGASVSNFKLYIDGEPVEAELLEADKARRTYEDIVRRMRDPALLEYAGRNLFKARVYPIPANGTRRVVLSYTETLTPDASVWTYRYPLNTEKFSSAPLETVSIDVKAGIGRKISTVYSTSHPNGEIKKTAEDEFRYTYEAHNVLPDKDFYLHFVTSGKEIVASPLVHRVPGEDGYVMLLLSAGDAPEEDAMPKDIVFVIDTSGSMRGSKIDQARSALRYCVKDLRENDRFELIPFSTEARPLFNGLRKADKANVAAAMENIGRMHAAGGTNIEEALSLALKALSERTLQDSRPAFVIFLTDGRPTVGERRVKGLMKTVLNNKGRSRFFVFGVGEDLNAVLLDRIAADTRGIKTYVGSEEDLEIKISSFYSKISRPALTDVTISFDGVTVHDVYPKNIGDIFYGQELVLLGRVRGDGNSHILIKGRRGTKDVVFESEAAFPAEATVPGLARIWAARKIAFLLEQIRLEGETKELREEIVQLAKKYGVITPYTSMLVVEDEETSPQPAPGPRLLVDRMRRRAGEAKAGFGVESGADAVSASRELAKMQTLGNAPEPPAAPGTIGVGGGRTREKKESLRDRLVMEEARDLVKHVGDKTFYKSGDAWEDSEFRPGMKVVEINYLGEEYFRILKDHPSAGKYLALGRSLLVVIDGTAYRIR